MSTMRWISPRRACAPTSPPRMAAGRWTYPISDDSGEGNAPAELGQQELRPPAQPVSYAPESGLLNNPAPSLRLTAGGPETEHTTHHQEQHRVRLAAHTMGVENVSYSVSYLLPPVSRLLARRRLRSAVCRLRSAVCGLLSVERSQSVNCEPSPVSHTPILPHWNSHPGIC